MNTLTILLAQTKSEAIIEILYLLVVAAIIGFVTSWLYYKSVYMKKIKGIESEKDELKNHIGFINTDRNNQAKGLREKEFDINFLKMEVKALKALHAEAIRETDDLTLKNIRAKQLLYEKDEALIHIAQRKHLLDYKSFGTATEAEKDDLKMISGIGPFIEERLHALDIYTFNQISKFSAIDVETINDAIEYFSGRIERDEWVFQAKELVNSEQKRLDLLSKIRGRKVHIYYNRIGIATKEEADDLTVIIGIGGWIQKKLNALDIYTFRQISNLNDEDVHKLTDAIEYFPGRIERDEWILQARELFKIEGKKVELLKRIKDHKYRLSFYRIGIAQKHKANNLTLINGIGLWLEERLNMMDIYTFEQISNLSYSDIEIISDILEITPDRISRENWVSQARVLDGKKVLQGFA
jgi:predicted flap endonuclease-1-like 5' DNA nuclease